MFFRTNIELLTDLFPRFDEEVVSRYSPAGSVELLSSKEGQPTCIVEGKLIHSRHDPLREAERIVEGNYSPEADCIVLLGFGLGYYAEACLKRYPDAHIIVVEPDVPFFLKALEARDYTGLWRCTRVSLLLDAGPEGVSTALTALKSRTCQVIALRGVYAAHAEYFDKVRFAVESHLSRSQINSNTLKRFGKLWVRNLSRNLEEIARAKDVSAFENRFAGLPALLIAGGPSLTAVIPRMPELRRRFVIVAVDTTLRACEAAGIRPDVLIVVDPQYWNTRHLDGTGLENLIVVSESSTHPRIFRLFDEAQRANGKARSPEGALYLCRSLFPLGRYVDDYTGITGKLGAGGSVATTAWDFLRFAGARPIVCAGLDLGFPDTTTHFRGSFFEERSHSLSSRTNPAETHSFSYIRNGSPFPTDDYAGGEVLTDRRMALYKGWFEDQLKQHPEAATRVVGDRGVKVEGCAPVDMEELLAYPVVRRQIDRIMVPLRTGSVQTGDTVDESGSIGPPENGTDKLAEVLRGIENLLRELEALGGTAESALEAVDDLEKRIRLGTSPAESLAVLDRLDRKILDSSSKEIAGFIMQRTAESIVPVAAEGPENKRTEAVLDNSRRLYSGIFESVRFNIRILGRALEILTRS